jgi:hypothetical protein
MGPVALGERALTVDRIAERIDDAPTPVRMGVEPQRAGPVGGRAEADVDLRLERLDGGARSVERYDLADLRSALGVEAHAFAELQEARQAGDPIVGRRDFRHDAADADLGQILFGQREGLLEPVEAVHGSGPGWAALRLCRRVS